MGWGSRWRLEKLLFKEWVVVVVVVAGLSLLGVCASACSGAVGDHRIA